MVVLEQYHVKQPDAVVTAATNLDGFLLEHAHAGSGLASVENAGLEALEALCIAGCGCCHAAHALHDIEHQALGLQQGANTPRNDKGNVAGLDMGTVANHDLHLQLGVKFLKHAARDSHASQDALFLDDEALATHLVGGDAAQGGSVAVTDVLGKRQIDQLVNQFFSCFHVISLSDLFL